MPNGSQSVTCGLNGASGACWFLSHSFYSSGSSSALPACQLHQLLSATQLTQVVSWFAGLLVCWFAGQLLVLPAMQLFVHGL